MPRRLPFVLVLTGCLLFAAVFSAWADTAPAATTDLTVIGWNVESGGADAATIAGQLGAFDGVDLWGLSEVSNDADALVYEIGAEFGEGSDFARVLGTTGGGDRLLALYDTGRFDLLSSGELGEINIGGNVRASLVLTLEERATGTTFLFMVNHLYRTDDTARHTQATLLNQWAQRQTLPAIAVGDYNFDYSTTTMQRDIGYNLMTLDDDWKWVRPATLVTTQCSGWPCAFNSVLDFVFVAAGANTWAATSEIVVRDGDFPDDATTSDHRPVKVVFTLPAQDGTGVLYLPVLAAAAGSGDGVPTTEATGTSTPTATSTPTPTGTATPTPTATATNTPTSTATQGATSTATATSIATGTATNIPTATATQPSAGPCPCNANTLNCSDFSTHTEAQACYDWCVSQGAGDIHRLDSDSDGIACESLPGVFTLVR